MAGKASIPIVSSTPLKDGNKDSHPKISVLTNLRNCDDQIASLESLIENNRKDEAKVLQKKKKLEESKEKLCEQQPKLQEKLQQVIEAITSSESECFSLRKKLPYLSRHAVVDNISLLELQLRLHNYRPREEELMLREISKLRNSLPVLEEYRTSVQLNRQYRSDRVRLVSQRNDCYDRLQALLPKIQSCSDQLSSVQQTLQENRKGLDEVKQHKAHLLEVAKKQLEKKRRRQQENEQHKDGAHTSLAPPAGASEMPLTPRRVVPVERDVYGPELAACGRLLQYCRSVGPVTCTDVTPTSTSSAASVGGSKQGAPPHLEGARAGTFYCKPKDDLEPSYGLQASHQHSIKKKKARNRAKRDLRHPPDVIGHFLDLGIEVPKNALDIPAVIIDVQQKLNYYEMLNEQIYFDTVKAIRAEDETADIIHVAYQTSDHSKKRKDCKKPCSSDSSKKIESLDARECSAGFVCHRTYNIFESDTNVEVLVGSSPPKLYSDIAKLPLTPVVELRSFSHPLELTLDENRMPPSLSEPSQDAVTAAAPVCTENLPPGEMITSAEEATKAVAERTSEALSEGNICCVRERESQPLPQCTTESLRINTSAVASFVDVKLISPNLDNPRSKDCSQEKNSISPGGVAGISSISTQRSGSDNDDCESGVYEADYAQQMNLMKITDNSSLVPGNLQKSTLVPPVQSSAVQSNARNSTIDSSVLTCRVQPSIVVECVSECTTETSIVMDPSCSSDSNSSSGCSCAGSSSASSVQGVTSHDQRETLPLPGQNSAVLSRKPSSVACCTESGSISSPVNETEESNKIDSQANIPRPTSLFLPSSASTQSNESIARSSVSAFKSHLQPCSTARLPYNSSKSKSFDKKNNNDPSAKTSGFCALSPCQAVALAVSEAATVVSYAAVTKKKS